MKPTNTIEEIRRNNLRLLIQECEAVTVDGKTYRAGSTTALAAKCNTSNSYLSQILTCFKLESGKSKEVGTELARKLEIGCNKPKGWMDAAHHDGKIEPNESEITNLFLAMDDKMRSVIIQQAKMLLELSEK